MSFVTPIIENRSSMSLIQWSRALRRSSHRASLVKSLRSLMALWEIARNRGVAMVTLLFSRRFAARPGGALFRVCVGGFAERSRLVNYLSLSQNDVSARCLFKRREREVLIIALSLLSFVTRENRTENLAIHSLTEIRHFTYVFCMHGQYALMDR